MTTELDVNGIIRELVDQGCLHQDSKLKEQMNGTTEGRVYVIEVAGEPRYVLKAEDPQYLAEVGQFHEAYAESPLIPKLHYLAPDRSFIVYAFVEGSIGEVREPKKEWMKQLTADLLNHYQAVELSGHTYSPEAWRNTIVEGLHFAKNEIGDRLPDADFELVKSFAEGYSKRIHGRVVLIHGDCGVHNFVFRDRKMLGVIDPNPQLGPLLYDFMYAFVSSPDDLNLDTLLPALQLLKDEPLEQPALIREVMIRLYHRIGICLLYHPHDLDEYLRAWMYWKALV
ncbi:aminoglycoside phosphotransferase family protein [Paenibacillus silvisoli]|uniref:aminoglycoside phosphotransferase family protein n=1 Tax=Paenibacillus silvisoli TaxID=3110539 RepID=UPI002804C6A2|nr:aminoglycoside phosphotransferase family protein [Paenibacillus silvisoli]